MPSIEALLAVMRNYAEVWKSLSADDKTDLARCWVAQVHAIRNAGLTGWKRAKDSIGVAIAIVLQAGWTPSQPHK